MVGNVVDERVAYLACITVTHLYLDMAAVLAEADAPVEEGVVRYFVQGAYEGPGVEPEVVVPFLELVQLLDDTHRDVDVIVLEVEDAPAVVEDHIGVQHEEFRGAGRAAVQPAEPVLHLSYSLSSHILPFMNISSQGVTSSPFLLG